MRAGCSTAHPLGPTNGYLAYLDALVAMGDSEALAVRVQTLRDICGRIDAPALTALCQVAEALAAIGEARMADAYGLIDEAMLPLLADQVPIDWAGDIYCVVLNQCHRLADLPRMRAWTQSMERWCNDFAASDTYGGVCDVHRLQLLAATDDYRLSRTRLLATSQALEDANSWAAGEGYYQLGEVRRLRGDADGAFAAFARARALLGVESATRRGAAAVPPRATARQRGPSCGSLLAGEDRLGRMRLLRGAVEVALARGSVDEAERHCAEMESGAEAFGTPGFRAWAAHARGAILAQQEQHAKALESLQSALREYRTQKSRYETAQIYEWMALAHRGLGEDDVAAADAATAQSIYDQLGVEPAGICGSASPGGLTKRELEILTAYCPWCNQSASGPADLHQREDGRDGTWPTSTPSSGCRPAPPRGLGAPAQPAEIAPATSFAPSMCAPKYILRPFRLPPWRPTF